MLPAISYSVTASLSPLLSDFFPQPVTPCSVFRYSVFRVPCSVTPCSVFRYSVTPLLRYSVNQLLSEPVTQYSVNQLLSTQ